MATNTAVSLSAVLFVAILAPACADEPAIEDGLDDTFATADDKADAFGVDDWSPDGAAVLKYVNSATKADLIDDAGLTARVATNIVKGRAGADGRTGTRDDRPYTDLAELDGQPYVGKTVFNALAGYALDAGLYKTSIRIPLVINMGEDSRGNNIIKPLSSFNAKLFAAGLRPFGKYIYIDAGSDVQARIDPYNVRITEMNEKLGLDLYDPTLYFGYNFSDYGSASACFVGDVAKVTSALEPAISVIVSEQYSIYAWRYGSKKFFAYDDEREYEAEYDAAWRSFNTRSKSIAIEYSTGDGGDDRSTDIIPSCR